MGHGASLAVLAPPSSGGAPPLLGDLSLSLSTQPIPAKLVNRIRSGQFVEMRDLLGDNIALNQHFETLNNACPAHVLPASSRPRLREVTSLTSWIYCFLTYLAVRCSDQVTRDGLIYARLVVQEALRHGGRGWLDYDRLFRHQAALNPSLPWNTLHASLMATTIMADRPGAGTFCSVCQGCDHLPSHCALAYIQQPVRQERVSYLQGGPWLDPTVCSSWNESWCSYPGPSCSCLHTCATYASPHHRARDCKDTPLDSRFRRSHRSVHSLPTRSAAPAFS